MPEYTGSTDEIHVISLPSSIETIRWSRRQVAPGGIVGLQLRTLWCGDGSSLTIQILDANGTPHATLNGELVGNHLSVNLRVPEAAKGAVTATVEMPNHGLRAESEALPLTKPVRVRGPRWSQKEVERGDVVTLTAEARGAPDGCRARVRLFEYDPHGAHTPISRMYPRVEGGAVKTKFRFQYPNATANIGPEWKAPKGYRPPKFFYRVDVNGIRADSKDSKTRGLLRFVDDLTVQVVDAESGVPYGNQDVELTLADGSNETVTLDAAGLATLEGVPPGPVQVHLPEPGAPNEETAPTVLPPQGASVRTAPGQASKPISIATGSSYRIRVTRDKQPSTF